MPKPNEFSLEERTLFNELFSNNPQQKDHFNQDFSQLTGHTIVDLKEHITHQVVLEALHGLENYLQDKSYSITAKKRVFMVVYESVQNLEFSWKAAELKIIDSSDSFIVYSLLTEKITTEARWLQDVKLAQRIIQKINTLSRQALRSIKINILKNNYSDDHLVYSGWLNVGLRITPPLTYHFDLLESETCALRIIAKITKH
ncbi:MAG: hypothetical protein ACPGJS_15295 [Flammeovirgaceae bacterium]